MPGRDSTDLTVLHPLRRHQENRDSLLRVPNAGRCSKERYGWPEKTQ